MNIYKMRQIWIREVRYYKYIVLLCMMLIGCGLFLLNDYYSVQGSYLIGATSLQLVENVNLSSGDNLIISKKIGRAHV